MCGLTALNMSVILTKTRSAVMVNMCGPMENNTLASGKKTSNTGTESTLGRTVENMKENLKRIIVKAEE